MPLNYLEGNPQDTYAVQRLGSTFSDALVGMQQNRIRQQQQLLQRQLDAQYFQLAQQKAARDERVSNADVESLRAQTGKYKADTARLEGEEQRQKKDFQSGGVMADATQDLYGTDATKNPDVAAFLRGLIAQQATRIAASNPQNIAKQSIMLGQASDPNVARLIATDTPATASVASGATLYDIANRRPLFQGPPRLSPVKDPQTQAMDLVKMLSTVHGSLNKSPYEQMQNEGNGLDASVMNALQGQLQKMGITDTNAPSTGSSGSGRIRVRSKDGQEGYYPADKAEQAKAKGYTILGQE